MTMFVTHPSVRIRGTENNYNPVQCLDPTCPNKNPHMHCPFCQKSESYLDAVILKAHYRVKHVDKGIDFAGLKILRCCDYCDIVGAIKGEKKFKGAHWHCYKCKNGFNRRDEAIKHYKTHFRNPQTTFQIHITQEVNHPIHYYEAQDDMQTFVQDDMNTTIHPVLTEAIMSAVHSSSNPLNNENDSSLANGQVQSDNDHIQVSVGANETVGALPDGHSAIMIIHEEMGNNSCQENDETTDKFQLDQKFFELQQEWQLKETQHMQTEQQLRKEIEHLNLQIQAQAREITSLKKREAELVHEMKSPLDSKLQEMMETLQTQHLELLQQQMLQVKRAVFISSSETVAAVNSESQLNNIMDSTLQPPPQPSIMNQSAGMDSSTMITLVMDRSGSLIPLCQPLFTQAIDTPKTFPINVSNSCAVDFDVPNAITTTGNGLESNTELGAGTETEGSKSPSDSLVIIDLTEEIKKREADRENGDDGISTNDSKRKKLKSPI